MNNEKLCSQNCDSFADTLNQHCYCKTLDRDLLARLLQTNNLTSEIFISHPHLFSNTAAFITQDQFSALTQIVEAIERVIHLPVFQEQLHLIEKPVNAAASVFVGIDVHMSEDGPRVIEINTNAGGGFLNAALFSAQIACCNVLNPASTQIETRLHGEFVTMFKNEWQLCRGDQPLHTIAIVDQTPEQQYLYPEFRIAQAVLQEAGFKVLILDPSELQWNGQDLLYQQQQIDLIYNRLTDFNLSDPEHQNLRKAYEANSVVITPNPFHHAIYANKRNLIYLGDEQLLESSGVSYSDSQILIKAIPKTVLLTSTNAVDLWQQRKQFFFKPSCGFGSKATYRGDKITTKVWEEILQGDYIAQELIPPSHRGVSVDGQLTELKMDIRAYAYQGKIQLLAARLYQGQTTNFRTTGGGFAPVFVV